MAPVDEDVSEPPNWSTYRAILKKNESRFKDFEYVERFDFYKRAKESFLVVATGEPDGNLILKEISS
jgi:L-fucose mutarotase